jgi:hypothetical protein
MFIPHFIKIKKSKETAFLDASSLLWGFAVIDAAKKHFNKKAH